MDAYIAITDYDWYRFLSAQPSLDEVNFWRPSGQNEFRAIKPGDWFFFKLHSPRDYIVGGGIFAHFDRLPIWLAWESFQQKNGAASLDEKLSHIARYRRSPAVSPDEQIGCLLIEQPFFLSQGLWIPAPADWSRSIVQGKTYDLAVGHGKALWDRVQQVLRARSLGEATRVAESQPRYGGPASVLPRLGQGSFRILVMDVYRRRCAVTGEKVLPALEAAHIKPYSEDGSHRVDNGILLRSDIHRLFDRGYVTVTPDYRFDVSKRVKDEFENGREYYAMGGRAISVPEASWARPNKDSLAWHNTQVFKG